VDYLSEMRRLCGGLAACVVLVGVWQRGLVSGVCLFRRVRRHGLVLAHLAVPVQTGQLQQHDPAASAEHDVKVVAGEIKHGDTEGEEKEVLVVVDFKCGLEGKCWNERSPRTRAQRCRTVLAHCTFKMMILHFVASCDFRGSCWVTSHIHCTVHSSGVRPPHPFA